MKPLITTSPAMSEAPFTPLLPGKLARPGAPSDLAPRFEPMQAAPAIPKTQPACKATEPVLTFQREGERITRLRVQCGCGEVMELDFEY